MSLLLTTPTIYGVSGTVWRVSSIHVDIDNIRSQVIVSLYVDSPTAATGKGQLTSLTYDWNGVDFPFTQQAMLSTTPLNAVYTKLLTLPEFAGATYLGIP